MKDYNTLDALGNEIVMGKLYGYAQSDNGFTKVVTGITKKFTPKGLVSLEVKNCKRALYMDKAEPFDNGKTVSVKPLCLFPITE